jgi:hypothetical protein
MERSEIRDRLAMRYRPATPYRCPRIALHLGYSASRAAALRIHVRKAVTFGGSRLTSG